MDFVHDVLFASLTEQLLRDIYIFTFYDIGLIDTFNENSSIRSDALNKIDTQYGQMKMCNISFTFTYLQSVNYL